MDTLFLQEAKRKFELKYLGNKIFFLLFGSLCSPKCTQSTDLKHAGCLIIVDFWHFECKKFLEKVKVNLNL